MLQKIDNLVIYSTISLNSSESFFCGSHDL